MLQVALALGAVYVIWGSTYLAIRFAIETIPPFLMAGARYLTAGGLLYGWSRLRGAPRPDRVHWRSAVIVGALLLLLGNGGVVWAEQRVSSGLVALLISTEPLWIVLFVWLRSRNERRSARPDFRTVAGLALGFIGLVILIKPGSSSGIHLAIAAVVLVASVSWAWGSLYGQRAALPSSPLLSTGMQMLCGGGLLFLAGLLTGEPARFALAQVSTRSLLALAYLTLFGAVVAFTAYVWLLRVASPVLVSTYAYVNPVVAVFLGWAVAGEPITKGTLIAAAVILTGVALISSAQGTPSREETSAENEERPAREVPEVGPAGGAMEAAEIEAEVCASR
jgi:drug/metabolite transporter (DMT)-like permease